MSVPGTTRRSPSSRGGSRDSARGARGGAARSRRDGQKLVQSVFQVKKRDVFRSRHSEGVRDTAGLGGRGQPSTRELKTGVAGNKRLERPEGGGGDGPAPAPAPPASEPAGLLRLGL